MSPNVRGGLQWCVVTSKVRGSLDYKTSGLLSTPLDGSTVQRCYTFPARFQQPSAIWCFISFGASCRVLSSMSKAGLEKETTQHVSCEVVSNVLHMRIVCEFVMRT